MVARGDERTIDDPRSTSVQVNREERREAWHEISDDPMHLRAGDREDRSQLAKCQVRAQREADDADPMVQRS